MRRGFSVLSLLLFAAGLLSLSGCEKSLGGNLVPVTGTVKMDGQPLAGASVTFLGVSGTPGLGGSGIADETGKFEISHFRAGKGLEPGEYKVVINKLVMADGSPIPTGTASAAELNTKDLVPKRYSDFSATTLLKTVGSDNAPVSLDNESR